MHPPRFATDSTVKFIVYLILVSLLPLAVVGLVAYQVARASIVAQAEANVAAQLSGQAQLISAQLRQVENLIANISGVETITRVLADPAPQDAYGQLATQARIGYILNAYVNLDGLVSIDLFSSRGEHYHVGDTLRVAEVDEATLTHIEAHALGAGGTVHWDGVTANVNQSSKNRLVIPAARALLRTDRETLVTRPMGLLMVNLDALALHRQLTRAVSSPGASLILLDGHQRFIHHPDPARLGKPADADLLSAVSAPGTGPREIAGEPVYLTCTSVPPPDWRLCHLMPASALLAETAVIRNATLAALVVALSIVAAATAFYTRDVVQPVREIIAAFKRLDLDQLAPDTRLRVRTRDEFGELTRWFNTFLDTLSARREAEDRLRHDASHDRLTGLHNRAWVTEHLQWRIERARRLGSYDFALLFLDLDRFKVVNDSLGHDAGDTLLIAVSRRLSDQLRRADSVARLGGDEFVVLLDDADEGRSRQVAERLVDALGAPFQIGDQSVQSGASIGVARAGPGYRRADEMLRDADIAMYHAKAAGKGRYALFDHGMLDKLVRRHALDQAFARALPEGELRLVFQPIVSMRDHRIVALEALTRWDHPELGAVNPEEFVPLAEESQFVLAFGHWVLREACTRLAGWRACSASARDLAVAINLSPRQLTDGGFIAAIPRLLMELGISGRNLVVEVTETTILTETAAAARVFARLRALGVRIHLDDFGTGYSSLSHLSGLPIDAVKIDRSFVGEIEHSERKRLILRGLVLLARQLGITTIAEGVETDAQWRALAEEDCDYCQGYLIARPLPGEEIADLIEGQHALRESLQGLAGGMG